MSRLCVHRFYTDTHEFERVSRTLSECCTAFSMSAEFERVTYPERKEGEIDARERRESPPTVRSSLEVYLELEQFPPSKSLTRRESRCAFPSVESLLSSRKQTLPVFHTALTVFLTRVLVLLLFTDNFLGERGKRHMTRSHNF